MNPKHRPSSDHILEIAERTNCSIEVREKFKARFSAGGLSIQENPTDHLGVYFFPYDRSTQRVFVVHHKKSGLWLSPGGHLDAGESPRETLRREVREELGIDLPPLAPLVPFLLTISPIDNAGHACRTHYDVWYALPSNGQAFVIETNEFMRFGWFDVSTARSIISDEANLAALHQIEVNLM